jgi:cytosine/adenosine deaminase-related metal-dependent hydrolase
VVPPKRQAHAAALVVRGARVVTMDAARRVLDADVVVVDGRITEVRRRPAAPRGRRRDASTAELDCTGLIVMPGLVQAHIHLCQTLFRGFTDDLSLEDWLATRIWPFEAAHTPETIYWSAMLGAAELLLGGTTAILDMETVRHTGAAFQALGEIGLRATAGKCLMDAPTNPAGLGEPTDRALQEAVDLCARWHGAEGGRLRYCFSPRFVPSCTGPLLRAVSDEAERAGAVVHTHAAETPLELELVKRATGQDEIGYLASMGIAGPRAALAHCVWADPDAIRSLARAGTNVVHCPSSNLKLGSGIAPIPEMLKAGVRVALGADGAPCNNRLDGFEEMRLAALIQKPRLGPDALPAETILELATLGGARALGLEQEIGSIEVGKRADLVAIDLSGPHGQPADAEMASRLVYAARSADVRHVVVDGRLVVRSGRLLTADLGEIRDQSNAAARRLRRVAARGSKPATRA